jgi:hypothetical protein
MGDGHFLDQDLFDRALGQVGGGEAIEEFTEAVVGLSVEDDGAGKDTVLETGAPAAVGASLGRDRPSGFSAVGARSGDLFFGTHF